MITPCGRKSSWSKFRAKVLLAVGTKEQDQIAGQHLCPQLVLGHLGVGGRVVCILEETGLLMG